LISSSGPLPQNGKLFTYVRYDAELTRAGLDELGCHNIAPEIVQKLDAVDGIPDLRTVGQAVAQMKVNEAHFARFPAA
jgi:uncharacterized protein